MEKEKKEKKEKKVLKETKKVVKEEVILPQGEKSAIKFIALLSAFFASGLAILIFVFSVIASISTLNLPSDSLVNNNIVITVVSKMNNYSSLEVKELITDMTNRFMFVLVNIIIPAIAFIGTMLLIIILAKRAIEFVADIKYERDLFTSSKLRNIQDIITILSVVLLATLVIFNEPSIIIYLLIELLLCIIYFVYKRCVLMNEK